ncbi:PREDICTED: zinc finger and BTB domain-containing protein 49-like isoform X2 [Dinoponera quadriceps]|uniref:Zinc finger and BTB domain-containing protein 49-like isoform X2 n=1 Tax=Dinoponera quadriceps TaxID=609295 RepID=A0A6P3X8G8_DINQU|nr:PREDICTED: zinc finger and BTB domain-containing protein 49-like isoform X2 [Dinoponera quadriceps]
MGTAARDLGQRDRQADRRPAVFQCRICAATITADDDGLHIFAEDGRRHYLQTKIRKYLYILVSSEDKFSKMVCSVCIKRLEGVHRFAMMAYRTQEKLKSQLYGNVDNTNSVQHEQMHNIKDTQDIAKKVEDRGLLHSILTKGAIEILTEDEAPGPPELNSQEDKHHTPNMEEMEVKVDPMLFLQCGMEESASEASDSSDKEEEIIRTSYSPEPLPLTKKNTEAEVGDEEKKDASGTKLYEDNGKTVSNMMVKPHECTICARSFISQIGLQNHLWSHLPRDRRFDGKAILRSQHVYSTNGVLHTNGDNNTSSNFICPICSKRISTKGNLKVHLETHRPKGKYGCDICGRIFKTQSNLFRHKEYHGGVQFPCNVCGRVYPTNSTLRAHSITHSDLRPHACPLCDKTFKRNQDLKFHINQHTGARPYQCPYCPKAFASSGNCFSHRKRMHPREVHRDRQRAADLMR